MLRKYGLPAIAVLGVCFGIFMVFVGRQKPPVPPIAFPPPESPYKRSIAAEGIIESNSENILIGVPFDEVIEEVYVTAGDRVEKGTPLFKLKTISLEAEKQEAIAAKNVAEADFNRLIAMPRQEEVPVTYAKAQAALANFENLFSEWSMYQKISDDRAVSQLTMTQKKWEAEKAKRQLDEAQAELNLLEAGAWIEDIEVAKQELEQKEKVVERVETQIERSLISAPVDGVVMQMNARVGESTKLFGETNPLMIFGSLDPYYLRIDIDQDEAWRFRKGAPATAFVRGNSNISIPLQFVRIEPYVVPKTAYTGDTFERVDTRVLQVLYSFKPDHFPVYPGLIMDVFIEAGD